MRWRRFLITDGVSEFLKNYVFRMIQLFFKSPESPDVAGATGSLGLLDLDGIERWRQRWNRYGNRTKEAENLFGRNSILQIKKCEKFV